jgi:hypothetical protein
MADIDTDRPPEREPLDVLVADVNRTRSRDAIARFEAHVGRLRTGVRENNPEAIDAAIEFLEADPWCFRSGYAKGRLMRHLAQIEPTSDQVVRLVNIVLHVVDRGGRPEFRDATHLARKIFVHNSVNASMEPTPPSPAVPSSHCWTFVVRA